MRTITLPDGRTIQLLEEGDEPVDIGAGGLRRAASDVAKGQSSFQRAMGGFGSGLQSVATGIDELTGRPLERVSAVLARLLGAEAPTDSQSRLEAGKGYLEGGGWEATAGDIAGKIAATAPIPANALTRVPILSALAARTPRLAQVIGTMLTSGGVAGVTTPGSLDERGEAAGMSAALAGVLPAVTGVAQATRRAVTPSGKVLSRAEMIRDRIGRGNEDAVLSALRGPYEGSRLGVQPSAGMLTGNPVIQQIEQGARVKAAPYFADRNAANAAARWDVLNRIAGDDSTLEGMKAMRNTVTTPARNAALLTARLKGGDFLGKLNKTADDILSDPSTTGADQAVVRLVQSRIQDKLERGLNDPAALYAIRKDLTEGYKALGMDASAAIRGATRTRTMLVKAIDDMLDEASDGAWGRYMTRYQQSSAPITSMQAAQAIRGKLENPAFDVPPVMGEQPGPALFGRQIKQQGMKQFGGTWKDRLTPQDRDLLEEISRDLARQQAVMKPTGTVGSPTAPLLAAQDVAEDIGAGLTGQAVGAMIGGAPGATLGGMVTTAGKRAASTARDRALAEILQDPAKLADLIEQARRAERVLGATTQASRAARSSPPME